MGGGVVNLLSHHDVAGRLGCSVALVRRLVSDRHLEVVRIGHRTVRVPEPDLDRFIRARTERAYRRAT